MLNLIEYLWRICDIETLWTRNKDDAYIFDC